MKIILASMKWKLYTCTDFLIVRLMKRMLP